MLDIRKTYGTDATKELAGVEHQIGENAWITVARDNNTEYTAMLSKLYNKNKFVIDQKSPESEQVAQQIAIQAMAAKILVGWRGDVGIDDEVLPYSPENAEKLLAVKDFRDLVQKLSREASNYRNAVAEVTAKN